MVKHGVAASEETTYHGKAEKSSATALALERPSLGRPTSRTTGLGMDS